MDKKVWIASGAALLLALGTAVAGAREMHGGGGGGGGRISAAPSGGMSGHAESGRMSGHVGSRTFVRSGNFADGNSDRHHRHHHGSRFVIGVPYYGGYDYGYSDCGWLYRRAVATGSAYWWHRYEVCAEEG